MTRPASSPLRRLRIRSERVPTCGPSSTRHMPWGDCRGGRMPGVSCTAVSTCRLWIATSMPSRGISSSARRASACCMANVRCSSHAAVPRQGRYSRYRDLRQDHLCPRAAQVRSQYGNFTRAIAPGRSREIRQAFDCPAEVEAHEAAALHRATERLSAVDGLRIYGTTPGKCAIVSFNVEGVHPTDMGMILDKLGIAVRTGQHCAEPTMTHFSTTGMCRASFALYNTLAEADALADRGTRGANAARIAGRATY